MGRYDKRFWVSDSTGMTKAERIGGTYRVYIPDMLADSQLALEPSCAAAVAQAHQSLALLEKSRVLTDLEPLSRLLVRAEAVSSSRIEGLEIPASRLMEYEELDRLGVEHRLDSVEAQVLGNVHALVQGLGAVVPGQRFTVADISEVNRRLLAGTRIEQMGGKLRDSQNWIGGNRVNPVGAKYVPPSPELVEPLMSDLVAFLNETDLPGVAAAALAHAQFETIHPFADGNGRTGRALVHMVLRASGFACTNVPPVSLMLATDRENYISQLMAFRADEGEDRLAAINGWVEYFARIVSEACGRALEFERQIGHIQAAWQERMGFRANSAGRLLLEALAGVPVISTKTAQELTGRSYPAVRGAINSLVEGGILVQSSKSRKSGIYAAWEVLEAFNGYERSLATLSGDTRMEKPRRPVPQRRR